MAQRPKRQTLAPADAADNNVCLSQTPGGAGALTLNGSTVTGGVATLDIRRRLLLTCAADESARSFTITGTADGEKVISEVLTGVAIGTATSLKDYLTITSITVDAATAGAVKIGTNATLGLNLACMSTPWCPICREVWETAFVAIPTGTINYTVEFTEDFMNAPGAAIDTYFNPFPHPSIANKTGKEFGSLDFPISAIRVTVNSYSSGAKLTFDIRMAAS